MAEIILIAAVGKFNVIGHGGKIPWMGKLPSDLRHFKELTMGHPVIMGRKTFDSLPKRPLPGRMNIVLSRNAPYDVVPATGGFFWAHSVEDALARVAPYDKAFVLGGEEVYRQFLPHANTVYLTRIREFFYGDAHFPRLPSSDWTLWSEERWPAFEGDEYPYSFLTFKRRSRP